MAMRLEGSAQARGERHFAIAVALTRRTAGAYGALRRFPSTAQTQRHSTHVDSRTLAER